MAENCVFCDRTKIEERLIHESENFYVVATLGQITNGGYVLLIPKEHISCMAAATPEHSWWHADLFEQLSSIGDGLQKEYGAERLTMFEHGIVGQTIKHAHLHFLPAYIDLTERIRRDFPTAEIDEIDGLPELAESYAKNPEPYLFWTTYDKTMVCWNPPAPAQYLRIVAADLLGRPERANWRNMDPELDQRLCDETVARLKPYFE